MDFQWHVPMACQWYFPTESNFAVVCSKGLSLFQWICTGSFQWTFTGTFQGKFTFMISGVVFRPDWASRFGLRRPVGRSSLADSRGSSVGRGVVGQKLGGTTPSPPIKSFPTKSPCKVSRRLPIKLYGHENSHPLESRVCLSQTL